MIRQIDYIPCIDIKDVLEGGRKPGGAIPVYTKNLNMNRVTIIK